MADVLDPGPEAVDKILDGLEQFKWSPTDVARQARRLRAHIEALRARPTVVTGERELSCERVTLNDRIKQLRAERKSYFDCEGDGVDVLLIDIQDHFDRAAAQKDLSA